MLDFYKKLIPFGKLSEIVENSKYTKVDPEWLMVLTDVVGSTKAIEAGKYKEVNTIAASSITALLNVAGDIPIPFVFGGDGTTAIIPPVMLDEVYSSMLATQQLSKNKFGLDIRVSIIPVKDLLDRGFELFIAKLKITDSYYQAVFMGDGFDEAERLLKDPKSTRYLLKESSDPMANFAGLTCRWQDIPSRHGQILSIIIKTLTKDKVKTEKIYKEIIGKIEQAFGEPSNYQPILAESLHLSLDQNRLSQESRVVTGQKTGLAVWLYQVKITLINMLGLVQELFGTKMKGYDSVEMKNSVMLNTDYKKFDGALKMIVSATPKTAEELEKYLGQLHKEGKIVYGIHTSDRALITCLVSQKANQEVHFVDGADGGYALAAKKLKAQVKALS